MVRQPCRIYSRGDYREIGDVGQLIGLLDKIAHLRAFRVDHPLVLDRVTFVASRVNSGDADGIRALIDKAVEGRAIFIRVNSVEHPMIRNRR